jgi:hypothetical protein
MTTAFRGADANGSGNITFADALKRYKSTGNNTLVVGTLSQSVACQLSRTHFGAVDESRYRVLAVTNPNGQIEQRFPPQLSSVDQDEKTRVITYSTTARGGASTTAHARPIESTGPDLESDGGDDLDAFKQTLFGEIESLHDESTGGFEPAQLRVSLDGLEPLLGMFGADAVDSFAQAVTSVIRTYDGMGQFFLSYPRSHPVVEALEEHFEIILTIEKQTDGSYSQQWDLREHGIQTRIPLQTD